MLAEATKKGLLTIVHCDTSLDEIRLRLFFCFSCLLRNKLSLEASDFEPPPKVVNTGIDQSESCNEKGEGEVDRWEG